MLLTLRRQSLQRRNVTPRLHQTNTHYQSDVSFQSIVEASIDAVRDLEETEFAAEPRDAEAALVEFINTVRDLEPTDFSKVFD